MLRYSMRISFDEFEELTAKALDGLPEELAARLDNIAVVVEEEAGPEDLEAVGLEQPDELLGLYRGIPITERESGYASLPDQVVIYRRPIVAICRSRREVIREVRDTLVHEIGHHFGLSDDEMPF